MNKRVLLTTLLVFSVGLNLVFVGIVVGRHLLGMSPDRRIKKIGYAGSQRRDTPKIAIHYA